MKSLLKSLKAVEVAAVMNLFLGSGLNLLGLTTGESSMIVSGSLMIVNGVILTNLR